MWGTAVKSRRHTVYKVFPFGKGAEEVTLIGKVEYGLNNGKEISVDWAGHAKLVVEGEKVRMKWYQIYLVSFLVFVCF